MLGEVYVLFQILSIAFFLFVSVTYVFLRQFNDDLAVSYPICPRKFFPESIGNLINFSASDPKRICLFASARAFRTFTR